VLKIALQHHLVSRLTSLVAVDVTPSRPANEPLESQDVPLQLPEGWDFGRAPEGGARATAASALLAKLVVAQGPAADGPKEPGMRLPQTDAGTVRDLVAGGLLLGLGLALLGLRRATPRAC